MRAVRWLVAAVSVCAVATGCTVASGDTEPQRSAADEIAFWIEVAVEAGASDHQLAILEHAQERGGILTYADVDEAYQDTLRCYEDAGLDYWVGREEATSGSNIWVPVASFPSPPGATEEDVMRIADVSAACEDLHHIWVASAYMNQPSSRQAQDAVWLSEPVLQCLEDRGYTFSDDVTSDEVRQAENEDRAKNQNDPDYQGPCVPNQG